MMKYPLYIGEGTFCSQFYFDLWQLRSDIEFWLYKDELFGGYDCEGRLLKFGQTPDKIPMLTVEAAEEEPAHLPELREMLMEYICDHYHNHPLLIAYYEQASLTELINEQVKIEQPLGQWYWSPNRRALNFEFPLTICDDQGKVQQFETLPLAESTLSPAWAEQGVYTGYDKTGRLLTIKAGNQGILWWKRDVLKIFLAEGIPTHQKELSELLLNQLEK